jgi:hypothetical protein
MAVVDTGYTPRKWKESNVIFLAKPGKTDMADPRSFRPISLMSFVYKGLEKVVSMQLDETTWKTNSMHKDQFGFRKGLSTEHALSATIGEIERGMAKNEFVVALLCDIKGAFDNVKPAAIANAMNRQGIDKRVCHWYYQDLTSRRCLCSLGDKVVKAKLLLGSPQGGILRPTCGWNCAMNELLEKSPVKCKAFADDLAIIVRGRILKKVLQQAQRAMNIAADWASSIGVKFSASKTMAMLFTRKRKKSCQSPGRLMLEAQPLPWVKEAKYLGVTIDDKLTWQPHITAKIKKGKEDTHGS